MQQLSSHHHQLAGRYTAVVVGSGYGGSVAVCRLARAGCDVALLERGREIHPGEFPATLTEAVADLQVTARGRTVGARRGLYWLHADGDVNVLSGCGLGGTSLINANVSLRVDDHVLADRRWPAGLGAGPVTLADGYARAEAMLQPQTYPDTLPLPARVEALAGAAGPGVLRLAPVNIHFTSGRNAAGVYQQACTGCGDCVTGCNVGAKNTLLMNYLPDAVGHGARVFTEVDVDHVERGPDGGWVVVASLPATATEGPRTRRIAADVVVLCAGSLGTTGILLRSQHHGLALSGRLGHRFTANGDTLGFAYGVPEALHTVGAGAGHPDELHPAGPTITAYLDRRGGAGVDAAADVVEDAAVPGALGSLLPEVLVPQGIVAWLRRHRGGGPLALLVSALTRGRRGALDHTLTMLRIGHDDGEGRLELAGGSVAVRWPGATGDATYRAASSEMADLAAAVGGTFVASPAWSDLLRPELVTVHPLGGCAMAERAEDGVVDHRGEVFAAAGGDATHRGLFAWDGSIMPTSLGVNPLLTIAALAERNVAILCAERGWAAGPAPATAAPVPPVPVGRPAADRVSTSAAPRTATPSTPPSTPSPARPGLRFHDEMAGFWSEPTEAAAADLALYCDAAERGEHAGRTVRFTLDIESDDLRKVLEDPATAMTATGTVDVDGLATGPLAVTGGRFHLLVPATRDLPGVHHMRYDLSLQAADGTAYRFDGFKVVEAGTLADVWHDTTTLYAAIRRNGDGRLVGLGVLRVSGDDFRVLLRSMTVTGPVGQLRRLELLAAFGARFAGRLFDDYGTAVARTTPFDPKAAPRRHRPLEVPPAEVHPYRSRDGLDLRLTRYHGGDRGPVVLVHGMGANPRTFSLDTIRPNLVEFLVAHGFDVWLQEWRGSTLLPAPAPFDADQVASNDHPAAEAAVRAATGRDEMHWVTHCVGTMTVLMAVLEGAVSPASLLCSQVAMHSVVPPLQQLKVDAHLGEMLHHAGIQRMTTDAVVGESWGQRLFDQSLRLYPIPRSERCTSAVCRRLAFIYGVAVHHAAVDELTHATLHELFGGTDLTMMSHLSACARVGHLVAADGSDRYLPHLDRLQLPITFLHGSHNLVWLPVSTERSHRLLVDTFGPARYRRVVFDGHGHQDTIMGASAPVDVFPHILDHLVRAGA